MEETSSASRVQRVEERRRVDAIRIDGCFSSKLPPQRESEREALLEDVRRHGVLVPLLLSADYLLLDGHRRLAAAKAAGLSDVPVVVIPTLAGTPAVTRPSETNGVAAEVSEWERVVFLATNLHHRVLTPGQRVALASSLERIESAKAHERKVEGARAGGRIVAERRRGGTSIPFEKQTKARARAGTTAARVSKSIGLNRCTYEKGRAVLKSGKPELARALIEGRVSVNAASRALRKERVSEKASAEPARKGTLQSLDAGVGQFRCIFADLTSEDREDFRTLVGHELGRLARDDDGAHLWLLVPWSDVRTGHVHALLASAAADWRSEVAWRVDAPGQRACRLTSAILIFAVLGMLPALEKDGRFGVVGSSEEDKDAARTALFDTMEAVSPGPRVALYGTPEREGWSMWSPGPTSSRPSHGMAGRPAWS